MKLIKINTDHYVVVDDSEIKEGDYWINDHPNSYYIDIKAPVSSSRFAVNSNAVFSNPKKITHSTKPVDNVNGFPAFIVGGVQEISLQEVKELIGEVDVEKKALSQFDSLSVPYSSEEDDYEDGWYVGYIRGYNQALEDNKEKKYTEEDMRKAFEYGKTLDGYDWFGDLLESLQPKTEWEVCFVDGKLKLV